MREQLKLLVEIQNVDLKILELSKLRDAFPARLREHSDRIEELERAVELQREQVNTMSADRRSRERTVEAEVEKIKKWESRLHEIKTNREYQALQREIELARKANSDAETEILELMNAIEDAQAHIKEMDKDLAESRAEYAQIEEETRKKTAELDEKIGAEQVQRDAMAKDVDRSLLRRYDVVRRRRGGVAVVPVDHGNCHGCHMHLPPQVYHIILAGKSVESCPNCTRLLYVSSDEGAEQAAEA